MLPPPTTPRTSTRYTLAGAYDAAQKRGEVATVGQPKSIVDDDNNKPTAADLVESGNEVIPSTAADLAGQRECLRRRWARRWGILVRERGPICNLCHAR